MTEIYGAIALIALMLAWWALIVQIRAETQLKPWTLWVLVGATGFITLVMNPVVEGIIDRALAGIATVIGNAAAVMLVWSTCEILRERQRQTEKADKQRRRRFWIMVTIQLILLGLYFVHIPRNDDPWPLWAAPLPKSLLIYWLILLGCALYFSTYMVVEGIKLADRAGPSPTRTSLLLIAAAGTCGWIIVFTNLSVILDAPYESNAIFEGLWFLGLFLALACVALALLWAWFAARPKARARRMTRYFTALEPLWRRLAHVDPSIVLAQPDADPALQVTRRLVEIHDGLMQISRQLPSDGYRQALALVCGIDSAAEPSWNIHVDAAAVWVNAGLQLSAGLREVESAATPTPGMEGDVETEARFFTAVAARMDAPNTRARAQELINTVRPHLSQGTPG